MTQKISQTTGAAGSLSIELLVLNLVLYGMSDLAGLRWKEEGGVVFVIYNLCYLHNAYRLSPLRGGSPMGILHGVLVSILRFAVPATIAVALLREPAASVVFLLRFCLLFSPLLLVVRLGMSLVLTKWGRIRRMRHALFIGPMSEMMEIYDRVKRTGHDIGGYFNEEKDLLVTPDDILYLGKTEALPAYLKRRAKKGETVEIYCALPPQREKEIRAVVSYCENHAIHFYGIPDLHTYLSHRIHTVLLDDIPLLCLHREPLSHPFNRGLKRMLDIVCSSLFLFTLFPLIYAVVGCIIKLTSPGPVLFRQKRNGINGKEFYCYKFRSMKVNSQADTLQATEHDPRKTRFGDFMRRTNIDELPQFINVLKGDMSMIGPRPHMLVHTEKYARLIDKYMTRHFVKPGITGLAQVCGLRGETKELYQMEERIRKDIWYLEHWSLGLDIRILWMTLWNTIRHNEKMAY